MSELRQICAAAREAEARHQTAWLATVVRVQGSAYRHPGARLLFTSERALAGSVSGGCLEASVMRKGPWLARERAHCLRFDGGRDDDENEVGRGTGCEGTVDILVERVSFAAGGLLDAFEGCTLRERRCAVVTVFESTDRAVPVGARLILAENGELSAPALTAEVAEAIAAVSARAFGEPRARARLVRGARFQALLEVIEPDPQLFVFGSGPDALPVVELANVLGLSVTVCEPSPRIAVRERFGRLARLHGGGLSALEPKLRACRTALGVIMSHHYPTDLDALRLLLESRAPYIGVLGPVRRTQRLLKDLFAHSSELAARALPRLHAPIGLDLGAETPQQIALSIVAEIQAVLNRASAVPLSQMNAQATHQAGGPIELALPRAPELTRTA